MEDAISFGSVNQRQNTGIMPGDRGLYKRGRYFHVSTNIYERSTLNLTLLHILSDGKQNKNNNNNVSKLSIQNPMLYYILFQKNIPGREGKGREGKGREGKGRNITTKVRQATVKSSCLITVLFAYASRQPVCSVSFDFDHSKTALKTTHKKKQDDDKGIKSNF